MRNNFWRSAPWLNNDLVRRRKKITPINRQPALEKIVFPAIKFWSWRIVDSDYAHPIRCLPEESARISDLVELSWFYVGHPEVWNLLTDIYAQHGQYPVRAFVKTLCHRAYINQLRKTRAQKRNPNEESLEDEIQTIDGAQAGRIIDGIASDSYQHPTFFKIEDLKGEFTAAEYAFIFDYHVEGTSLRDFAAKSGIPKSTLHRNEQEIRRRLAAVLGRYERTSVKRYSCASRDTDLSTASPLSLGSSLRFH